MNDINDFIGGLKRVIPTERRMRCTINKDFMKGLKEITSEKELIGVTYDKCKANDICDGRVMKFYKYTSPEYFDNRGYQEHHEKTYKKYIIDVPPRKFYSESEIRVFIGIIERRANRTLEMAEIELLLSYITSGQHYELVGLVDINREHKKLTTYEDIKK